ncbi:hypothetical protein EYR40_002280 [Pleurotus pulmonarius]|nr:hypothetical protein EYR36_002229 [Pleurotus pulmonarius]KAF4583789.1 hypothetical protein EYR40_002280 [Pleurotus pulmonarius]
MTISTPSRDILARQDKAGIQPTNDKELSTTLLLEAKAAQVHDFDTLLRAFIFRCLPDESSIRNLQDETEKLEREINLDESQESALSALQAKRDEALQNHLEQCLLAVLPVANCEVMKNKLSDYLNSLSAAETERYGPYVTLCNEALPMLKKIKLPLRPPTSPDLKYRRLDPSVFKSYTETDCIHRKPDVGKGDPVAVTALGPELHLPPAQATSPQFNAFYGFEEFKAIGSPSDQACAALKTNFTTARRVRVIPSDNEIDETAEGVDAASSAQPSPTGSAAPNDRATSTSMHLATRSGSSRSSKRKNEATDKPKGSKRLCLGTQAGIELRKESNSTKNSDGRVQCTAYALEMLSQNLGIQHVINLLHIDDCVYIWYYDREGIVRSNGISFVADFPRALVLMALFQRFTLEDWGRNKAFDCPPDTQSFTVSLSDPLLRNKYNPENLVHLEIKSSARDYLSPPPRCLGGRATRVLPCEATLGGGTCLTESLVVKLSHPEARRTHEGATMKGIRTIAMKYDETMTSHLPELLCYADVDGTDTGRIRSLVGKPGNSYRVMRMVVMKKLEKITTLDAPSFLRAWLDAVACHAFLWKHGVEHGDPSLYNIMCHPETHRGVLTDFDLSILQWEERVPSCDWMGTIPFMALELLNDDYWSGDIARYYHHEMEAFVWCLPFMCLGGFAGNSKRHKIITAWVTATPSECHEKKTSFLDTLRKYASHVPPSFATCYQLAMELCWGTQDVRMKVARDLLPPSVQPLHFWTMFLEKLKSTKWRTLESTPSNSIPVLDDGLIGPLIERLEKHQPHFGGLDDSTKSQLKMIFLADSEPLSLRADPTGESA